MKVAELDELFFLKENFVDVNASAIGTSAKNWETIKYEEATDKNNALEKMRGRFDVLPIKSKSPQNPRDREYLVREYFQTDRWNDYSLISRKTITHKDFIPLKTHIRDVIKGFASEQRPFYFLSNEHRIAGIVTIADLNRRPVRIYLFSLLSELETLLSILIDHEKITEEELLNIKYRENDEAIRKSYRKDKANGVEVSFLVHLYLSNLFQIIEEKSLYLKLDYNKKDDFNEHFEPISKFRNSIVHPKRSIVTNEQSVTELWERIERIEEALFKLRHLD